VKKLILVTLVIILAVGGALSACAEPTAAPSPAPTPTPAPKEPEQPGKYVVIEPKVKLAPAKPTAEEAPEEVYKLKYSDWGPPHIDLGVRAKEWIQVLNERSGGRIVVDGFWAEALLKRPDTIRGCSAGLADIVLYVLGAVPGAHKINRVIDLPGTGIPGQAAMSDIYNALYEKYPEFQEEYGNTFPIFMRGLPAEHIHTTDKFHLVKTPDDLAGLKTYANPLWEEQLGSKGASVINPTVMDMYMSLDTNLIQGMFVHWLFTYSFGLTELFKHHAVCGEGGTGMQTIGYIMNSESYEQLPPDLQKILVDTIREWMVDIMMNEDDPKTIQAGIDLANELGNEIYYMTEEEQQQWVDFAQPIHEQWIADREKEGYSNARDIYNDMMQMVEVYKEKGHL
jgi:TRAP-type C4-dicarboxylate transport system substrate-binding protein